MTTRTGAGNSRSSVGEALDRLAGQPLPDSCESSDVVQVVQLQLGEQEHRRHGQQRDGDILDEVAAPAPGGLVHGRPPF